MYAGNVGIFASRLILFLDEIILLLSLNYTRAGKDAIHKLQIIRVTFHKYYIIKYFDDFNRSTLQM